MRLSSLVLLSLCLVHIFGCSIDVQENFNNEEIYKASQNESVSTKKVQNYMDILALSNLDVQDVTIRSTPLRYTFSFYLVDTIEMDNFINNVEDKIKLQKGWVLLDNKKGARIYCLTNELTFEIHEPLNKSRIKYDMNDPNENKNIFKIVQLERDWNLRFFLHKNGYDLCSNGKLK